MNTLKRITILCLLVAVFVHAAASYAPLGETSDACESDCCVTAHQMTPPEALAAGQCCVIECPPEAEIPPVFTFSNPAPQFTDGLLPTAPPAQCVVAAHTQAPRARPRYLPASSCRYLQTGALLI